MIGLGTIINTATVVAGGVIGCLVGRLIKDRFRQIVLVAVGLVVVFMGAGGAVAKMLTFENGTFNAGGTLVCLFSLVIGGVIGEIINLDNLTEKFGGWLKEKSKSSRDSQFVDGFVTASVTICIGAMAVIGSITDGLTGDFSILLTKAIIDFVTVMIMSASMGKGCVFSAIPIFVLQGLMTVLARFIEPLLNEQAMNNLLMVGSILIFCVGMNLLFTRRVRIKVTNLMPSVILAVVAAYIPFLN